MPAAIGDPYATAAEFRDRVGKSDTTVDATILVQLTAVSRYLDRRLHRFFTQDAAVVTRTFDGNGDTVLWLPVDIASTTSMVVKVDLNEDYDFGEANETLTLNTHFWVGPQDAEKGPEPRPFDCLEIIPNNGVFDVWPEQARAVQVAAKFGWPAVPNAIKEVTISVTRQLRDILESGVTMTMENIDAAIQSSPSTMALILDIERMYSRPLMGSC
jgi:hypothetical protein